MKVLIINNAEKGDREFTQPLESILSGIKCEWVAVNQKHKDSISLPEEFVLLAHSDKCKVQVMKHRTRPVYSTQFHAELSNSLIIENFIAISEQRRYQ